MSKDVRLLPAVIGVGAILFALKAAGVVFSATAATAPATPAATPAAGAPPTTDPTAAIHAAMPIQHGQQTATNDTPQPSLPPELEGSGVTSAEMDVLSSLADRRSALDDRERDLQLRANLLAATEQRVNQKIAELKTLQSQIQQLIDQSQTLEKAQVDALVKAYSGMKPADAARIFAQLDDHVRLAVASRMKPDAIAGILAKMPAAEAQKLTVELATRMKLPANAAATTAAPTPTTTPATPSVQNPTPQTVASLTPPTGTTTTPAAAPIAAPTMPSVTTPTAAAPATPSATPAAMPGPTPAPQTQANLQTPKPAPAVAPVVAPPAATPTPVAAHAPQQPAHRAPAAAPRRAAPRQTATRAPASLQHAGAPAAPPATEPAPAAPQTQAAPALTSPTPALTPPATPALPRETHGATSPPGP